MCRAVVGAFDGPRLEAKWHAEIRAALCCTAKVTQALMTLLPAGKLDAAYAHYEANRDHSFGAGRNP